MTPTFLVVDDSKSSRRLNIAYLQDLLDAKANCLEAAGGAEALTLLAAQSVDVVLLDLTMPGMSGFDVLAEMRRLNLTPPVIVISADIQRLTRERVAALGAVGFIEKPVRPEALHAMLTKLGVVHE